jgi:hypothetical protein
VREGKAVRAATSAKHLPIMCGECAHFEERADFKASQLHQCARRPASLPEAFGLRAIAYYDMPVNCPGGKKSR